MGKMGLFHWIAHLAVVMEARVRVAPLEQMWQGRPRRRVARFRAQPQAQRPHETAVVIVGSAAADQQELKYHAFGHFRLTDGRAH